MSGGLVTMSLLGAHDLSGLVQSNPFTDATLTTEKAVETAPPVQLELRGVVKEKGGYRLNIYDGQARKSHWVHPGDRVNTTVIGNYDSLNETLELDSGGQSMALALKTTKPRDPARGTRAMVASAAAPIPIKAQTAVAVLPPESEVQRMEVLAQLIRQRREQRGKHAEPGSLSEI